MIGGCEGERKINPLGRSGKGVLSNAKTILRDRPPTTETSESES